MSIRLVHVSLNTNACAVHQKQVHLNLNPILESYWSEIKSLTRGPTCQVFLLPLARGEEREESEISRFGPLKNRFLSPIERGDERDEMNLLMEQIEARRERNSCRYQ